MSATPTEIVLNLSDHIGDATVGETLTADIEAALDLISSLRAENAALKANPLAGAPEENPNCVCDYCSSRPLGDT